MDDLKRLEELIEDVADIKTIEDRENGTEEIVKMIAKKAKGFRSVKPIHGKGIPASTLLYSRGQR